MFKKNKQFQRNQRGDFLMNRHNLTLLSEKDGLYDQLAWNTKMYLHYKGVSKIQNLALLPALRTLYLQHNLVEDLQGLSEAQSLMCLFLQHNNIKSLETLPSLSNLILVNLSCNRLFSLQGISKLQALQNLSATQNFFQTSQSIYEISCCPMLTNLDLSNNKLQSQVLKHPTNTLESFLQLIAKCRLVCLRLVGNPLIRQVVNYRLTIIGHQPSLNYLDDRPVEPDDRRVGQAYLMGGRAGQKQMRTLIKEEKQRQKEQRKKQLRSTMDGFRRRKISNFSYYLDHAQNSLTKLRVQSAKSFEHSSKQKENQIIQQIEFMRQAIERNRSLIGREISTQGSDNLSSANQESQGGSGFDLNSRSNREQISEQRKSESEKSIEQID